MRTISYLNLQLVTDETLAELVIRYARALALSEIADTVTIPVLAGSGEVESFELLIGPASQMIIGPAIDSDVELDAAAAIESLRQKLERIAPGEIESFGSTWDTEDFDG